MKKVICIVLALIFVLSFAACGGSGSNTPAPANSPAASPASGGGTSDGGYAGGEYNLKIATLKNQSWYDITAKVESRFSKVYNRRGPVFTIEAIEPAAEPSQPVATFY